MNFVSLNFDAHDQLLGVIIGENSEPDINLF